MTALASPVLQTPPQPPAPLLVSPRLLQRKCACGGSVGLSGRCAECGKRRLSRRAAGPAAVEQVPAGVHEALRAPGQPLDDATRKRMEAGFGYDLSRVRIHSDARSAESAGAVDAAWSEEMELMATRYEPCITGTRVMR